VEASELPDELVTGPEVQVVRVAQEDLGAKRGHLVRVERLDRRLRPDGHEDGRLDVAVGGPQQTGAGTSVCRLYLEDEPL
jgi:hypothetical protein